MSKAVLRSVLCVTAVAVLALCLASGCGPKPALEEAAKMPEGPPRPSLDTGAAKAKIVAYINVTSGCQEATIATLEELDKQYGDSVTLEIVDFGDDGPGAQRWKDAGYDCLTIETNGSVDQVWEENGQQSIVRFSWPEGYSWVEKDLRAMVAAWVEGRAHVATAEEAARIREPMKLAIESEGVTKTEDGQEHGLLMIGDKEAIRFKVARGDEKPGARAARAADMVQAFTEGPPQPPEFSRKKTDAGWEIHLGEKLVAVCTQEDAAAEATDVEKLSKQWLTGLREAMSIAVKAASDAEAAA